ncbi:MAG: response regulator transcription factor [Calditrichaeota bacterium]|nr:response regulator transcription factor [Calditrichota bacterium]
MHILIAEDEKSLAQSLQKSFLAEGFEASVVFDGKSALEFIKSHSVDLLLLDWRMPGLSGYEVCKKLHSQGNKIPIILLTALSDVSNKVQALNAGADDYITKPFAFKELMARIQAVSRRFKNASDSLSFGSCSLNLITHEIKSEKGNLKLSEKEFELLFYFVQHKNSIITREQIATDVWKLNFLPSTNFIETTIKNLRKKLGEITDCNHIKTVYGEGYTFIEE